MYTISDWDNFYENAQSRKHRDTKWVPMPNKRGFGYNRILRQENGEAMFGCWCAIVQLASTCSPRGKLQSNDIAYTIQDISDITLFSIETVENTINYCVDVLKWMKWESNGSVVVEEYHSGRFDSTDFSSILFSSVQSNSKKSKKIKTEEINIPDTLLPTLAKFKEHRKKMRKPMTEYAITLLIKKLNDFYPGNVEKQVRCMQESIENGWQGVFKLKEDKGSKESWQKGQFRENIEVGNFLDD